MIRKTVILLLSFGALAFCALAVLTRTDAWKDREHGDATLINEPYYVRSSCQQGELAIYAEYRGEWTKLSPESEAELAKLDAIGPRGPWPPPYRPALLPVLEFSHSRFPALHFQWEGFSVDADNSTACDTDLRAWRISREDGDQSPLVSEAQKTTVSIVLPIWLLVCVSLLLAAYPALAVVRRTLRGHRRGREGLCRHCGYDLRGCPGSQCSECGAAFDPERQRQARLCWEEGRAGPPNGARYKASYLRKTVTVLCPIGVLLSAVLWGVSYYTVTYFGPKLSCRATSGNLIIYRSPESDVFTGRFRAAKGELHVAEFHDASTMWWPAPFLRDGGRALYIPFWMAILLFALLWCLSYRPIYRRRWRSLNEG